MDEQGRAEVRYERESLVAALRDRGISYLAPSDAVAREAPESDAKLLCALLHQEDSRMRLAIVPLLLRHPEISASVPDLAVRLDKAALLELQTLYMAAVYLQRNWRSRLSIYLDEVTLLPDLFSQQMGLPLPEERFGKLGLVELADAWQARSRYPFERLQAINSTFELFIGQLKLEKANLTHAP
ncbi:MAG: hypothetical protein F4X14_02620 [Caldilineaceae bacterium SB0661_bin_32]|uniref:Uncharacterized protein n=1 Tax=Caldilineaceae bacterium SB0661_bin_32 TaxID=2605255 RepID=A0A6B1D1X8_9CHLR|nr:hypothetical protein [Caldilineaceae bacterium SB0661_bin_32]